MPRTKRKNDYTLSNLAIKAVNEVKHSIKKLIEDRKKGNFIKALPEDSKLNLETVRKASECKSRIDVLISEVKSLEDKYKPLREEILRDLPGNKEDKVEFLIEDLGIQIKKHTQIKGAGTLDHNKVMELVKRKKMMMRVTKTVRVIDEDLLMLEVANKNITEEEYLSCVSEGKGIEHLKLEQKFIPEVVIDESAIQEEQEVV